LRSWLLLVCQEEVVHNLDSVHDLLLSKDVLDDHQSDVVLELHEGRVEFVLGDALCKQRNKEVVFARVLFAT
jgi:hypothetical protein